MGFLKKSSGALILVPFLPALSYGAGCYNITLFSIHELPTLPNVIWYSGVALAVLSLWSISQRTTQSALQLFIYLIFLPLVYLFVSTSNLLTFFMCYEFFLLPSFLIIFFGSPNRRGVLASIYFLMWTQVGSFLVFAAIILVFFENNSFSFSGVGCISAIPTALALIGFGIKVPMWPAHYWLTKTHVEAPTYFSIYLSGFLVKTALYGVWLFSHTKFENIHTIFLVVAIVGVIDSSMKMWAQVDLKKLVAYGTVQEMNLILIGFLLSSAAAIKAVSLFILAHTILSTIFFLLSDSLYRRYGARSTTAVRGLLQTSPSLGYTLFVCCLFFAGLPFTLKFVVEVYIFTQLLNLSSSLVVVLLLVCNWFGLVSFMKNWFVVLFGSLSDSNLVDISYRELLVYSILCLLLFIISFVGIFIL